MRYLGKPLAELFQSGDYMDLVCAKCGEGCETDLVLMHAHVPVLRVDCKNCGVLSESKLGPTTGLGFQE
jgi:hypothetical protein